MLRRACDRANLVDKFRQTLEQLTHEKDSLRTTESEQNIRARSLIKLLSVRGPAMARISDLLQAASTGVGERAVSIACVAQRCLHCH